MLHGYTCDHVIQNMQMKMNQMMNFTKVNSKSLKLHQFLKPENKCKKNVLENHGKYYYLIDEIRNLGTMLSVVE